MDSSLLSSSKKVVNSDSLVIGSYGFDAGAAKSELFPRLRIVAGRLETRSLRCSFTWLPGWNCLICSVDGRLTSTGSTKLAYLMRMTAAVRRSKMSRHCTAASHLPESPESTMLQYMAAVCSSSTEMRCLASSQLKMAYKNEDPAINRLCVAAHV
ncbi:hypothetical protein OGATHE_004094 [Ogataea polymorpha]|uniref:Uncharacterized protein n=1 Tax=Ogataea polymorpha TaxID=460523 RepID=A0A9P8P5Y3_9ASCO|nr:hypothetical protein OGATHE_004094 [Ogataea polymorpha]